MKKPILFLIIILSISVFQSCEKEPTVENPDNLVAPQIPPQELLLPPTADFRNGDDPDTNSGSVNGITYWNWYMQD